MIPGGFMAAVEYRRRKQVDWRLTRIILVTSLPGLYVGLLLSHTISVSMSKLVLGVFLLAVTFLLLRPFLKRAKVALEHSHPCGAAGSANVVILTGLGLLAGVTSTLTGVGGALVLIPVMVALGMEPVKAVGTGILTSACIALFGAAGHLLNLSTVPLALACVAVALSSAGTWLGARMSSRFNGTSVKLLIICLCFASGVYFVLGGME
jgi:uncharacterized membrane protein YfcA